MELWHWAVVALLLALCAAGLMALHVRTWHAAQRQQVEPAEIDYRRRQFRRRMQTSAMLGMVAVAIFLGQLISSPVGELIYWGVVLILVLWVGLLALADILATKYHFGRLRQTYLVEQAKLRAELRRIQSARGNGQARDEKRELGIGD